jgi:hypothetical protein
MGYKLAARAAAVMWTICVCVSRERGDMQEVAAHAKGSRFTYTQYATSPAHEAVILLVENTMPSSPPTRKHQYLLHDSMQQSNQY